MTAATLPADVQALLDTTSIAHVATTLPDGAPHSVPVWIATMDGAPAFLTGPGSVKARNLARDPRVAISVVHPEDPYRMATVRGRADRRLEGEEAWREIDRISRKYTGGDYPRDEPRVLFVVTVERASATAFG